MARVTLARERALQGLTLHIDGDIILQRGEKIEKTALAAAIEERGGGLSSRRSAAVDIAVLGPDAAPRPQMKQLESWWQKPCLRTVDLAHFLQDLPHGRPGPADALFGYVRFCKELRHSDVAATIQSLALKKARVDFLWAKGWLYEAFHRSHYPAMLPSRCLLLGMLPQIFVHWADGGGEGSLRFSPKLRFESETLKWLLTLQDDNGCHHTILDTPFDNGEAAVYAGNYGSEEIFLWEPSQPTALHPLARDVWEYLLLAVEHKGCYGWMKDACGL